MAKAQRAPEEEQTIREQLRLNELLNREDAAKTTQFDKPTEVERTGTKIAVPAQMRPEKAKEAINAWVEGELKQVDVTEYIDGVPIDAAHALMLAVQHEYGIVDLTTIRTMWGERRPPFFSVPTSHRGENADVYVGPFTLPGFEKASFNSFPDDEAIRLGVQATLRRKDLPLFKQLMRTARRYLQAHSIYKGKAITVDFGTTVPDDQGNTRMFLPEFWDVTEEKPLILAEATYRDIEATIFTPIRHRAAVKAMGTPIKRTVLLYGTYGTGKSLTAYETARQAVANGYTFLYVTDVKFLKKALDFTGGQLLPAVVFMEDTEKAFEDPAQVNMIQNTLDGVDTKDRDLIVILTSNHVEQLPPAIMRPGRIDTIIQLHPADAVTAARLIRLYAGDLLSPDSDMDVIGKAVEGSIPATIREVVERSKLYALARLDGVGPFTINHEDIASSARGMAEHMRLLSVAKTVLTSPVEMFGSSLGSSLATPIINAFAAAVSGLMNIREQVPAPVAQHQQVNGKAHHS